MVKLITTVWIPGVCCGVEVSDSYASVLAALAAAGSRITEDYKLGRERSYAVEDINGNVIATYSRETHGIDNHGQLFVYDTEPLPAL